jgi:hypothetical protein
MDSIFSSLMFAVLPFLGLLLWGFLLWMAWLLVRSVRGMHDEMVRIREILGETVR